MRRDHLRPAGVGDVRAQAVLGSASRDERGAVLAPREPDEPGPDRTQPRVQAGGLPDQVGQHDRSACEGGRHPRGLSALSASPVLRFEDLDCENPEEAGGKGAGLAKMTRLGMLVPAGFVGQQETFLNVHGREKVLERIKDCWASFFSERALFYRSRKGNLSDLGMAVVVQRQLAPDRSGVMFTIDPVRRRRDQMMIEAVWGLGEAVVSGSATPDHYVVSRDGVVKKAQVSVQEMAVRADASGGVRQYALTAAEGGARVLKDADLAELAKIGRQLETHFGHPLDVEWAYEGG